MDIATLALIGVVILVAALLSGVVERTRFPQVALFLLLGLALGPLGMGLVHFGLTSPVLETLATLGLVLVLFTDAVGVNITEARRHRTLIRVVLGPGTLLTAALIAVAAWALLGIAPGFAAILGAALASTDPVMMRGLLRNPDVPVAARHVLALESGLNDLVLLPIVLIAMALLGGAKEEWAPAAIKLFLVGPVTGIAIGFVGVALLERVRRWMGVRRDYESLYALGLAFTAYAAAEAVHGSGFLAAFAAGLTIAASDAELCDCFLDLGQAAAEMFLLFTFVAFGSSLIWTGFDGVTWRSVVFAIIALGARSAVLAVTLPHKGLDPRSRRLIIWFGPRALSTLLLVLLPVFAGLPGAEGLFAPAALVVMLSIAVHGGALMVFRKKSAPPASGETPAATDRSRLGRSTERITLEELKALQERGEHVALLDVRKDGAWNESDQKARGAVRLPPPPDDAAQRAAELALPRNDWLVAYCA